MSSNNAGHQDPERECNVRIMTVKEVCKLTSISRAHLYRLEDQGVFPKRLQITRGKVGYFERDVVKWIRSRSRAGSRRRSEDDSGAPTSPAAPL